MEISQVAPAARGFVAANGVRFAAPDDRPLFAVLTCIRHRTDPRGVYENHLDELKNLMSKGVGKLPLTDLEAPAWRGETCSSRSARSG